MASHFSDATPGDSRLGTVVLTHNRLDELVRTLEQLLAIPERPAIVVVDNASTDGTEAFMRERLSGLQYVHLDTNVGGFTSSTPWPVTTGLQYVRLDTNVGGAGRNAGVRLCHRPYVALYDDDTWCEPGSLGRAADLFDAHPRLDVVTGKVLVGESERIDPICTLLAQSPLTYCPEPPGPL